MAAPSSQSVHRGHYHRPSQYCCYQVSWPAPQSVTNSKPQMLTRLNCRYWGKRDTTLNLPTNSSLSVTLSQRSLRTLTTASCSSIYPAEDTLNLNGKPQEIQSSKRTLACLSNLRALRKALEEADSSLPKLSSFPLRIVSENNFPTAAGLASSAAGFAALVRAVADLYHLPQSPRELRPHCTTGVWLRLPVPDGWVRCMAHR